MPDGSKLAFAGQPDRLRIFVTSTIDECAKQRRQVLAAIRGLELDAFLFEREGARPYGPRSLYLAKLSTCHMAVGIYRSKYGWVDTSNEQTLSGLEDEYREIERLDLDLLAYVERDVERDERLGNLIDELLTKRTAHFFDEADDLEPVVRSDIMTLLSQTYANQRVEANRRSLAPSLTLDAIFRLVPYRVSRRALHARLQDALVSSRLIWVTGEAGSGKTVLVAEHAASTDAPYVNARGLEPRELLAKAADALRRLPTEDFNSPRTYEEARAIFREAWQSAVDWPLVIDDPSDLATLWKELRPLLADQSTGSVIIASRQAPDEATGQRVEVVGFDTSELVQLERVVTSDAQRNLTALASTSEHILPIIARGAVDPASQGTGTGDAPIETQFQQLTGAARDLVAFVALSPVPLTLEDLVALQGEQSLAMVHDTAASASHLLVEDAFGYSLLHESWSLAIHNTVANTPQYQVSIRERLIERLSEEGLFFAAFQIARETDGDRAALFARRSLRSIVFTGSIRNLVEALEYLVEQSRAKGDRESLAVDLIFLAQMASHRHGQVYCLPLIDEAAAIAAEIADPELSAFVETSAVTYRLQTSGSVDALETVRRLRESCEASGDLLRAGKLLIDEAVAYMAITEGEQAAPLLRKAITYFEQIGDEYGRDIAARNLASVLIEGAETRDEAQALIETLNQASRESERHRAWECNILNRRYRREGRLDEAEALAREAMAIGEKLGDRYLVAINLVCLGNTFRDRKDSAEAIPFYVEASREAAAISRPDIDGRASRLAAAAHNDLAREGIEPTENAMRAELFARHSIGVLAESVATYDLADAWDELGTALAVLNRHEEARQANARGVHLFAASGEFEMSGQLRRALARQIKDLPIIEVSVLILASFGIEPEPGSPPLSLWNDAVKQTLEDAEPDALPSILSLLVRKLRDATPSPIRDHALDTLLRGLIDETGLVQPGRWPMLLLAILAWFRTADLTSAQLMRYAALCLDGESALRMRTTLDQDIYLAVEIGRERQHLFTFHGDIAQTDEVYLALCLASFITVFGQTISEKFIAPLAEGPQAFEVVAMSMSDCPSDIRPKIQRYLEELPVAMIGFEREAGKHPTIAAFAREDLLTTMITDEERVSTFEIVLVTLLQAIVEYCLGAAPENFKDETIALSRRLLF